MAYCRAAKTGDGPPVVLVHTRGKTGGARLGRTAMAHDYLMRQIETMSRALALLVFKRDELSVLDIFNEEEQAEGDKLLRYSLGRLLGQKRVNEAENLLFEYLDANVAGPTAYYEAGLDFYRQLLEMDEEELAACDFSVEEIEEGLAELEKRIMGPR